jgi:hypothetical protein
LNNFTIHITTSDYSGDAKEFHFEKNFLRKYFDVNRVLTPEDLIRIGEFIQDDIIGITKKWGWQSIPEAVILEQLGPNEVIVTITDEKQQLSKWLNFGTEAHWVGPKNKKALHWEVPGVNQWGAKFVGGDAFSKGHNVRGISAYDFFKVSKDSRSNIQMYIGNRLKLWGK